MNTMARYSGVGIMLMQLCFAVDGMPNLAQVPTYSGLVTVPSGTLSGIASFRQGIALQGVDTALVLDLFAPLDQALNLNGGTVQLARDLTLAGAFSFPTAGRICGDTHTLFASAPITIVDSVTVASDLTIDGGGSTLMGPLVIADGVTLTLKNVTLNLNANAIGFQSGTSTLVLDGVSINLHENFTLSNGSLRIRNAAISGAHSFIFASPQTSLIAPHGILHLYGGATMHFIGSALTTNRSLLNGADATAILYLDYDSTLSSETPGLVFDTGLILIDNNVTIKSTGLSPTDAISLLDPTRTREATMKLLAAAHLTIHGFMTVE